VRGDNLNIDDYLNDVDRLEVRIDDYARLFAQELDLNLFLDHNTLRICINSFRQTFYRQYDLISGKPGHIKMMGHLLFCLTQLEGDDGDKITFAYSRNFQTKEDSVNTQFEDRRKLCHDFFNEAVSVGFVFQEFMRMQSLRTDAKNRLSSDLRLHNRYFRAMIDYLRIWGRENPTGIRSSYDLYMIFKTMDLFGMDADYN
jgi:hypothetical protein